MFCAAPAQAYLVTADFSGRVTFSGDLGAGDLGAGDVTTSLTYETVSETVTALSINIDGTFGNPAGTISGPLAISSSSIMIDGLSMTDFYDFFITISNGPILRTTQSNGFVRSAQLTQVHFNSGQNTNPIADNTFDENLFPAFVPRSGVQPQRMFLTFTLAPGAELNTGGTVVHNPTSVRVSEVPVPGTIVFALSAVGLLAAAKRRGASAS